MTGSRRIVGVDFGTKRVGLAKSDPLCMFAQPLGTYSPPDSIAAICEIDAGDGIDVIVIGWPLDSDGNENVSTERVDEYIVDLCASLPGIRSDQISTDQTGTEQTGTDQTGIDQTGIDQTGIDQIGSDAANSDPIRGSEIRLVKWDERGSSRAAVQELVRAGARRKQRGRAGAIDRVAAALILQEYLDERNADTDNAF